MIFLYAGLGKSIRKIEALLKRSPSTISRELKRNTSKQRTYYPSTTQREYSVRKKFSGRKQLLKDKKLKEKIRRLFIQEQWSPEQISYRLKQENYPVTIRHNTIYHSIYFIEEILMTPSLKIVEVL